MQGARNGRWTDQLDSKIRIGDLDLAGVDKLQAGHEGLIFGIVQNDFAIA